MSRGVGHRCGLDPALLRLWCRPAAAAPIGHLAWELPYATDVAIKREEKKKNVEGITFTAFLSLSMVKLFQ